MARRYYSSTAVETTLTASVTSSEVLLSVAATTGYPTSFPFTIVLEEGTANEELCEVTGAGTGGATWTVLRGGSVDGSSGKPHSLGASVRHAVSARDFDEPNAHIDASTNVHGVGVSNAVVGTGSTQTLTNKTISGASNTVSPSSLTVSTATIQDNAVTTAKINAGAVTTAKIAAGAVTATELATDSVTAAKIAAGAVDTSELASGAVTTAKIAAGAVTATELGSGAVTNAKIGSGAVDTAQLSNDAVTAAKIAAGAVDTSELATSAVTTAKIADGNVTQAKLSGNLGTVKFDKDFYDVGSTGGWTAGYLEVNTGLSSGVTGFVGTLVGTNARILTIVAMNTRGDGSTSNANGYVRLYLQNNSATAITSGTQNIHWIAW